MRVALPVGKCRLVLLLLRRRAAITAHPATWTAPSAAAAGCPPMSNAPPLALRDVTQPQPGPLARHPDGDEAGPGVEPAVEQAVARARMGRSRRKPSAARRVAAAESYTRFWRCDCGRRARRSAGIGPRRGGSRGGRPGDPCRPLSASRRRSPRRSIRTGGTTMDKRQSHRDVVQDQGTEYRRRTIPSRGRVLGYDTR